MTGAQRVRRKTSRGFTLIEVLIVIAIIAVLTAMVVPAIRHAQALARRAVCMANLRAIHAAYSQMRSEQHIKIGGALALPLHVDGQADAFNFWQIPRQKGQKIDGAILPYLQNNIDFFSCPEDQGRTGNVSGFAAEGLVIQGEFFWSNYGDPSNQWGGKWWITLYESKSTERYKHYQGPPGTYQLIAEDNVIGGSGHERMSEPGVHPLPEESDKKGWNILLEIEEFSGKPAWVRVVWVSSGLQHDLYDKYGNMIMRDMNAGDEIGVLQGNVSYGVNSLFGSLPRAGNWILALDYAASVAHCTGAEISDDPNKETDDDWGRWWDEEEERYQFARHMGQTNALHINGQVASYFPKDINPHPNRDEDGDEGNVQKAARERRDYYWRPPPARVRFDDTSENDYTDQEDDEDAPGPRW